MYAGLKSSKIQALQAWKEVSWVSRHCIPGYSYLIPSGSEQEPRTPSSAARLKALNMNSPRQSLGRRMQPETSLEGLNHKVKSIFDEVVKK
jgi:hypothetical protein